MTGMNISETVCIYFLSPASLQLPQSGFFGKRSADVFAKQLRTYLVLSGLEIGLVMNFGMALMRDGIVRVINSCNLNVS